MAKSITENNRTGLENPPYVIDGISLGEKTLGEFLDWEFVTGKKDVREFARLKLDGKISISKAAMEKACAAARLRGINSIGKRG